MRAFFALPLAEGTAIDLERWRDSKLPVFSRPVPRSNYHLTLAFLGEISERQCRDIQALAESIRVPVFELRIDTTGYWPKQRIYYVAPSEVPDPLLELVNELSACAKRLSIRTNKRKYLPHLTLARRCDRPPPAALMAPDIRICCETFVLFESVGGRSGVRYDEVDRWDLRLN